MPDWDALIDSYIANKPQRHQFGSDDDYNAALGRYCQTLRLAAQQLNVTPTTALPENSRLEADGVVSRIRTRYVVQERE
jgi:hypothetical protein